QQRARQPVRGVQLLDHVDRHAGQVEVDRQHDKPGQHDQRHEGPVGQRPRTARPPGPARRVPGSARAVRAAGPARARPGPPAAPRAWTSWDAITTALAPARSTSRPVNAGTARPASAPIEITGPATFSGSPTSLVRYTRVSGRNKPDPKLSTPSAVSSAVWLR